MTITLTVKYTQNNRSMLQEISCKLMLQIKVPVMSFLHLVNFILQASHGHLADIA